MKATKFMMFMAAVVAMIFMAVACSEKNTIEPEEPSKPDTPVNKDDWHTVPASGGDISVDNFTLSLPSGTFTTEQKVAVTQLKKGQLCGDNEVSAFYQVTTPLTTHKPLTVKVASEDLGEGISLVMHEDGYTQSGVGTVPSNVYMETTYANGAYTATIPEMSNGDGDETLSFAVGLVKVPTIGKAETRGLFDEPTIAKGEVNGVKYALYASPSATSNDDAWLAIGDEIHAIVTQSIEQSLQLLFDMGFTLKTPLFEKRTVPFYYMKFDDSKIYGQHIASKRHFKYSIIGLGVDPIASALSSPTFDPTDLKTTIIHELFHLFQYDMDPREQFNKGAGYYMGNMSILYEMGSVWSEQFMNNGELNATFIYEQITPDTKLGMGMEKERLNNNMQEQGYTLGPWLHYILGEMKSQKLLHEGKHPVFELFDIFSKKWTYWLGTYNTYNIIQEWLDSYKSAELTYWWSMDEYYLKLWQGQVVKGFNIHDAYKALSTTRTTFENTFTKLSADGECYPYGCWADKFKMKNYKGIDLSHKELVVKQENRGVKTYLLTANEQGRVAKINVKEEGFLPKSCYQGGSIVLSGKELEALRRSDGTFNLEVFVITMPVDSPTLPEAEKGKMLPSHVTVELRDAVESNYHLTVKPRVLEFDTEGGEQKITVNKGSFKLCNCFWENNTTQWGEKAQYDNDSTIVVTFPKNETEEERTATLVVWGANKDYDQLDMATDVHDTVKVVIRQKGQAKVPLFRYVMLNFSVFNTGPNATHQVPQIKEGETVWDNGTKKVDKIATVREGNTLRVTATSLTTRGGDEPLRKEITISFTLNGFDGSTSWWNTTYITDLSYKEYWSTYNGYYYELGVDKVAFRDYSRWSDNLLRFQSKYPNLSITNYLDKKVYDDYTEMEWNYSLSDLRLREGNWVDVEIHE